MVTCVIVDVGNIVTRKGKRNNFPLLVNMKEAIQIHLKNFKITLIITRQKYEANLQENTNPEI